jgi:aminoglycoside phosphotransferase family enzyme/predicted kinase
MAANENAQIDRTAKGPRFPFPELLVGMGFPHGVATVRLVETYISWIMLTGELAYKIKKPVSFDFLDAGTLERRRMLCEEELRLNQRLAPDLYLRVAPLTRDPNGIRIDGSGPIVEYAVCMREFSAADQLDRRLALGAVLPQDLAAFGTRLADFHRHAAVAGADSPYGNYDEVRQQVFENLATLIANLPAEQNLRSLSRLSEWSRAATTTLEPLIRLRKDSGAVRECHGDLHARNLVYWHGTLTPFDCLEFAPALRWIDGVSDTAFLFMDLLAHGRKDLAFAFLNGYLERSGDYEGLRLLRFYAVYRALVRAKVDALGARSAPPKAASDMHEHLARRLQIAAGFLAPTQPVLIIMNGVAASGKSHVSTDLALRLGAVRVRSDLERKRLTGAAALSHRAFEVGGGDYDETSNNRTYARLAECSDAALAAGQHVVIDAAFLERGRRALFHALADEHGCPFMIVSCDASVDVLRDRLAGRRAAAGDPSEATSAVLEHQLRTRDALTAHELTHTIRVRTDAPDSHESAMAAIGAWVGRAAPCRAALGG